MADTTGNIEPRVRARSGLARAQLQLADPAAALAATGDEARTGVPDRETGQLLLEGLALLELRRLMESVRIFGNTVTAATEMLALAESERCRPARSCTSADRTRRSYRRSGSSRRSGRSVRPGHSRYQRRRRGRRHPPPARHDRPPRPVRNPRRNPRRARTVTGHQPGRRAGHPGLGATAHHATSASAERFSPVSLVGVGGACRMPVSSQVGPGPGVGSSPQPVEVAAQPADRANPPQASRFTHARGRASGSSGTLVAGRCRPSLPLGSAS